MNLHLKYLGIATRGTKELYIGHGHWFCGLWIPYKGNEIIILIRLGTYAIRIKNGFAYFSERHGYDVPVLRFAGWRLFIDKSRKLKL